MRPLACRRSQPSRVAAATAQAHEASPRLDVCKCESCRSDRNERAERIPVARMHRDACMCALKRSSRAYVCSPACLTAARGSRLGLLHAGRARLDEIYTFSIQPPCTPRTTPRTSVSTGGVAAATLRRDGEQRLNMLRSTCGLRSTVLHVHSSMGACASTRLRLSGVRAPCTMACTVLRRVSFAVALAGAWT